jgi:hypothetical protein
MLRSLVGLAFVAGCGAADSIKTPLSFACPDGTGEVGVKDVLSTPPPGTEIVPSDPKSAAPFKKSLREESGNTVRSIYSRVVARPGRTYGTGVYVTNLNERMDPRAIEAGAKAAEEEPGIEHQELITIAGEDALLLRGPGGVVVTGVAGDCSAVTLTGENEAQVRAVAESIRRAE